VPDPLIDLAQEIAAETGRLVPTPNPEGPTTGALALFVLRDPGATPTSGANATGILDPYVNRDPTAVRARRLLETAKIDPAVCLWWNAVPYHLGYDGPIKDHDRLRGARYLREFVRRCERLRVVVAMGDGARSVCQEAWRGVEGLPPLIATWHPMTRGRGGAARQAELVRDIRRAAQLIRR
jgi:hypothetical protein